VRHLVRCSATLCVLLLATTLACASETEDCRIGSYRLNDGSVVDIAPSDKDALRWRRFDGTTGALRRDANGQWRSSYGWTGRADGKAVSFAECSAGEIDFDGVRGHRIAFDVTDTTFKSHEIALAGRLVMPKGRGKVPLAILLHGAERDSALTYYSLQRMLPAEGVAVFVYDKRGTGRSGGTYSHDFDLLADDAVAAMREARRLAGARAGRVGYQAGSQGGWVAPIASNRAPVDFVIVCFGLAVSIIDEDQQQVEMEMRDKGYSTDEISKAQEVARAAENVIASGFTQGFQEFDAVRAQYREERWYKELHGNYTWVLLPHTEAELREMAPNFNWGTPFHYDPMPTLRAGTTPQLWILGGRDYEAPSAETSRRIRSLIADGRLFTLALYAQAEHGMTLFETAPNGERLSTRWPVGYFALIRDFAREGRLPKTYGDAEITAAR
jgi:pimeloyl-ACP methyl ester carboxylesterase